MSDDSREITNVIAYWNNWCLDNKTTVLTKLIQTVQRKVILLPYSADSSVILHQKPFYYGNHTYIIL